MNDLIHNSLRKPTLDEITDWMSSPGREWWEDLHTYLQQQYKTWPKLAYSKCAGKPGWNLKYQKSGKTLCTLYPEPNCFTALVVIAPELAPVIQEKGQDFHSTILDQLQRAKPYLGGLWLMVPVTEPGLLDSLKKLIACKVKG